jgi:hypothetical protein
MQIHQSFSTNILHDQKERSQWIQDIHDSCNYSNKLKDRRIRTRRTCNLSYTFFRYISYNDQQRKNRNDAIKTHNPGSTKQCHWCELRSSKHIDITCPSTFPPSREGTQTKTFANTLCHYYKLDALEPVELRHTILYFQLRPKNCWASPAPRPERSVNFIRPHTWSFSLQRKRLLFAPIEWKVHFFHYVFSLRVLLFFLSLSTILGGMN